MSAHRRLVTVIGLAASVLSSICVGEQVNIPASADATVYALNEQGQYLANGGGEYIFAGNNDRNETRRALIRFDLSAIPAGSTITQVTLTLNQSRSRSATNIVSLHRVLAPWGEGTSNPANAEGQGTTPTTGDVTWVYRFYATQTWDTPGGDFVGTPSASASVSGQNGFFSWSSAGMVSDVQGWLADPASNFGWVIRGVETTNQTAHRFDSRTNGTIGNRPVLTVTYTPPGNLGACCLRGGGCTLTTATDCTGVGGTFQGAGTTCTPNPCPQPTGACCLPEGGCSVLTEANCVAQGGTYRGDGVPCTPDPCGLTTTISLVSVRDNTLYQDVTGSLSNGAGIGMFAGIDMGARRRALVRFDLSSIPTNAIVSDARLRLTVGFLQASAADTFSVYRVTADWGEGASNASGNESAGAASQPGDATWIHRIHPGVLWSTPGGDFAPGARASLNIPPANGTYEWSSPGLVADVQAWLQGSAPNYGWLVAGTEGAGRNTRRFDTREGAIPPQLVVTYSIPEPRGACCLPTGACIEATAPDCAAQGGTYRGDGTSCSGIACPIVLTPFVDALPLPSVAQPIIGQPGGAAHYRIAMQEVMQRFHRDLPLTRVWGYGGSYPGPTIEARSGLPVTVEWINDLRVYETGQLRSVHSLPVDTCLHGPDETGLVPAAIVHLHGGKVAQSSDGYPEWAFPPGEESGVYTYPNNQQAATLWYHDHALGITRLNVYMGLAGYYIIRDDFEDSLNLPRGEYEVPLAIQDRSFNPDGSLKYLDMWMEHFFGDFIVVNGKVWPYLNVDRGKYRFRMLNGSTSRTYTLALSNGATFHQIGTDTGLLAMPVPLTQLTIQPGERADVVIDFEPYAPGTRITLLNSAPSPFPIGGAGPDIADVMQFVVGANAGDTDPLPSALRPFVPIPESDAILQRNIQLVRMPNPCPGAMNDMWTLNGLAWNDISEFPRIGTTEIWAWVNRSGVSHPMHMHLVSFQVLDRQDFIIQNGDVVPVGPRVAPSANEVGWKDTVQAPPNQITRVIARFDGYPGRFPYHCHILEHEDHEMMRQFEVRCDSPSIIAQPQNVQACENDEAVLALLATGDVLSFQWRRNGVALIDGPTAHGSVISGATTPSLTIAAIKGQDAGAYSCLVTNPCGEAASGAAILTVELCAACDPDVNCDGSADGFDVEAMEQAVGGDVSNFCQTDLDFNRDGSVDGFDIESLEQVVGGGPCP